MIIPVVKLTAGMMVSSALGKTTGVVLKSFVLPNVIRKTDKIIITAGMAIVGGVTSHVLKKEMANQIDEFINSMYEDNEEKKPSLTFEEVFEKRTKEKEKKEELELEKKEELELEFKEMFEKSRTKKTIDHILKTHNEEEKEMINDLLERVNYREPELFKEKVMAEEEKLRKKEGFYDMYPHFKEKVEEERAKEEQEKK